MNGTFQIFFNDLKDACRFLKSLFGTSGLELVEHNKRNISVGFLKILIACLSLLLLLVCGFLGLTQLGALNLAVLWFKELCGACAALLS